MEKIRERFEIIRPYTDQEAAEAVGRIVKDARFLDMVHYLFGNENTEELLFNFSQIKSTDEFQTHFSSDAVQAVVNKTTSHFSYGGLEKLDAAKSYLFVANHRDIVMDSALMQLVLVTNGHRTSQITFGSNLMSSQFVVDLGKINKMFTLYRGGTRLEQYNNALLHAAYIYDTICNKDESVWIAQRDGRTKDGNDQTQIGLLKMFSLGASNVCKRLKELNIVPLTISYEYEPCDYSKVNELYIKNQGVDYVKHPNEDLESVLNGIRSYKGRVHIEFGEPLNKFIGQLENSNLDNNEKIAIIAGEIDRQVYLNYKLSSTNYIAYDQLEKNRRFEAHYSEKEVSEFEEYLDNQLNKIEGDRDQLRGYFLRMYGYPVINMLKASGLI